MVHPPYTPFIALQDAPFAVHQTGSRYIGFHKESSDWDFVTQDSPETRAWLLNAGFKHSALFAANSYEDEGKTDGYTTAVLDAWDGPTKVQVQLTHSLVAKLWARDFIKQSPSLAKTHFQYNTKERIKLWRSLCDSAEWFIANTVHWTDCTVTVAQSA